MLEKAREAVDLENVCPRGRGVWETEQSGEVTEGSIPATAIQNDAVVVGVGSSHDEVRLASAGGCDRRQDGGQQLLQCSALGKIDLVRSKEFSEGRGRGGLKSKQRICFHNDACVVPRLALWNCCAEPSTQPSRRAEGTGCRLSLASFGHDGTDVSWSACSGGSSQGVAPRTEVYEVGPAAVDLAPCRSNLVSLPANLEGSPNLADLLPPHVDIF